jgi:histidine triad (HIT) family protein
LFLLGQRIARAMRRALNPRRVGMIVHGFGVRHAHLVVLPLEHAWDITAAQFSYIENGEVRFRPDQVPIPPRAELDSLAARLRAALSA